MLPLVWASVLIGKIVLLLHLLTEPRHQWSFWALVHLVHECYTHLYSATDTEVLLWRLLTDTECALRPLRRFAVFIPWKLTIIVDLRGQTIQFICDLSCLYSGTTLQIVILQGKITFEVSWETKMLSSNNNVSNPCMISVALIIKEA